MPGPILPIAAGIAARAAAKKAATKAAGKVAKKTTTKVTKKSSNTSSVEKLLRDLPKAPKMSPADIRRFEKAVDRLTAAEKAGKVSKIKKKK
jgi:hypothetical protein